MVEAKPDTEFLAGGGEMGERIRGFDWLPTPLGPIAEWSLTMRLAIGLCVKSRFPIIIHWGWPALTVLYNDAFIPFAGEKHPSLLGRPLFESWPELQPTLGPMLESVLTTGNAALSDDLLLVYDRSGYLEETYYTLSFNPIVLESGNVGGSFSLIDYTTDRVISERRLRTLRDLACRTGEARQVEESYRIAAEVLATNPQDIPFALLYMVDENRKQGRLVATAGLEKEGAASPAVVDLMAQERSPFGWPLGRVASRGLNERVEALEAKFGPLPGGVWRVSPQTALVLPITLPGHELPSGLLVAAVNPRKALDDSYQAFLDSVARQVEASLVGVLAYQGLVALDRAKTTFFSNVSHEFRTPLTLLISPLEELLTSKGSLMCSEERAALELAVQNGLRLQKLVNSLLDFSRIEAHRVQAAYQPTDLAALTSNLASVFRSAVEKAGMRLIVDCPPLAQLIYVDHEMWEKIVLNLLSNAFKYTFEGEIRICLQQVGNAIELSVSDTGVGIPEGELSRIFERFHRVESTHGRTAEGTGIGLALVQELVKLHGGTIRADSSGGGGSVFTVSIPIGKDHLPAKSWSADKILTPTGTSSRAFVEEALRWLPEASAGTNSIKSPTSGAEGVHRLSVPDFTEVSGSRARILLADDNADMRNYVRALLGERYEITTAADGETALATLRQNPPDLVLTDVMMPRLDGFGLLKAIRSDPATSRIPVILLSARAGDESKVEGMEHGADDYLAKPFSARELSARVAAHVALARLRKEASEREAQERRAADLRLIVDTVPGFVWTMTAAGEVELVNRQMLEYFGKPLEELKSWTTSDAVHSDDLPRTVAAWNDSVKRAAPYDVDHRLRRADGTYRWFHSRGIPLRDSEGRITRWYNLLTDINERKQTEEKLRRSEESLLETKDRLHDENLALREQIDQAFMFEEIVGSAPVLKTVLASIVKVAPTDSTVLISGETGTGKELIARAIHKGSRRSGQAFITVNCASIPPSLIASELFGHEKGAFTGALQQRQGRFELAHSGTIFLDEVGELPAETQIALLRVLQERQFERVGGNRAIPADVRVIAATNRDLSAAIAAGTFRPDLFYRLNVFPIQLPPLRERKQDIPILVEYFVKRFSEKMGKQIRKIDKKTFELCRKYYWPGNIRELQNIIERSVILCSGDTFWIEDAWLSIQEPPHVESSGLLTRALQNQEKEIIEAALAESKGKVAGPNGAAAILGIPRSTLDRKIQQLKIKKYKFTTEP